MKDKRKQEFVLLLLIVVFSLAMGVYFGNRIVVEEGFVDVSKVKDGLKNAKTIKDVKTEYMRVINNANKAKDNVVEQVKSTVLGKFGLFA